jgi:CPA2 family monovalent cation:H+ antiporter-2
MHGDFELLVNLSASLVFALVCGLITHRLRLSPIVGYIIAGILLGPQTPGLVADQKMAAELAEVGVVLLMFGVGLHFNLRDLLAVRRIALPGAIGQILAATLLGAVVTVMAGHELGAGIVIGVAISVASTVVLVRMLMDNQVLETPQGHIAIGWLIVEDIFTVLVLVALPALADVLGHEAESGREVVVALGTALARVALLSVVVLGAGRTIIPWLLRHVAETRSRELFTLTVLALALAIATGSAVGFGVSMALGAFLAGTVVGQTEVSHQAAADALPMRDAFAVLFFVSVGMLLDPAVLWHHPFFLLGLLAVVLVAKPLIAFLIAWVLRYSVRTAITVAVGLAQIGEFSFLLAEEARRHELLPPESHSLLVACAILSITLNPFLFRAIVPLENRLRRLPRFWRVLNRRSEARGAELNAEAKLRLAAEASGEDTVSAVIVGHGPVGETAARVLDNFGVRPVVIDLNLDTVRNLVDAGQVAVYGDAAHRDILEAAGIQRSKYLLVTVPDSVARSNVIMNASELNPDLRIFVRARYLAERVWLEEVGATGIVTEEGETAAGLALMLLRVLGVDEARIEAELRIIQQELADRDARGQA